MLILTDWVTQSWVLRAEEGREERVQGVSEGVKERRSREERRLGRKIRRMWRQNCGRRRQEKIRMFV